MAAKSTQSLMDFPESSRPMEAIGRSNSSNSLTGESSSASRVKVNGMFVGGVRGMSGAIKMERSEHERAKYPDRINLDRKGLHGGYSLYLGVLIRCMGAFNNYVDIILSLFDLPQRAQFLP